MADSDRVKPAESGGKAEESSEGQQFDLGKVVVEQASQLQYYICLPLPVFSCLLLIHFPFLTFAYVFHFLQFVISSGNLKK